MECGECMACCDHSDCDDDGDVDGDCPEWDCPNEPAVYAYQYAKLDVERWKSIAVKALFDLKTMGYDISSESPDALEEVRRYEESNG